MVQAGSGAGLAVTAVITGSVYPVAYLVIGPGALLTLIPTVLAARGERLIPVPRAPSRPLGETLKEFFRPLAGGDFMSVSLTRLAATAGINSVPSSAFNFLRDVV